MATITIPIVLDASASATIFSEAQPITDASYVFTMNSSALKATDLSNFLQYIDREDSDPLFMYTSDGRLDVSTNLHADICNQNIVYVPADSEDFPNHTGGSLQNATLGDMLVKYIASVLFGHPEAQAPIKNDQSIIERVQTTSDIHGQFVAQLSAGLNADATTDASGASNDIVLSIFEQLVAYSSTNETNVEGYDPDTNRFGNISHEEYRGIPFLTGDTIIFLIRMAGNLTTDDQNSTGDNYTPSTVPAITTLFAGNPDLDGSDLVPKVWELRITLA